MNLLKKSFLIVITLVVYNFSFSQLNKASCTDILSNVTMENFQKLKVYTTASQENASNGMVNFEISSAKFFYNETYLTIKDATGLVVHVPYNSIKMIKTAPKSGSEYSNISIYLLN